MFIFPMIHFARNVKWIDCCSVTKSCPTLCDPMDCTTPGFQSFTVSQSLLRFMSIESVMLSNHLILCLPLLLLTSILPSIRVFYNELALRIRWPKIGASVSASVSVLPVNSQGWFPLGLTGLISLQSKGLSRVFSSTTIQKHQYPLYTYPKCFFCFPNQWSRSPSHNSVQLTLCMQASHS